MRYFSLMDDYTVMALGEYETISEAFDASEQMPVGANVVWVFNEVSLRELRDNITEVL